MAYQYPPSPHTIMTVPVDVEFDVSPSTPSQEAPTPVLTTPAERNPLHPLSLTMHDAEHPSTSLPSITKQPFVHPQPASTNGHAPRRRYSRFDPMSKEDDPERSLDDLGPLRQPERGEINLPGIKALFGTLEPHPPNNLFHSSSLPSLVSHSPTSSPSSARTSRHPFLASEGQSVGWWAPEYGRASPFQLESNPREDLADQHHDKRRRSDEPPAHDGEELAVLRWQAQSRNASYPVNDSISGPGRPALLHPSSAHMSRHAVSGPSWESPGHRPPEVMRSSSLAGRQLALSFADLTASEIPPDTRSSPVPFDRRASLFPPTEENRRGSLVALGHSLSGPPTPDRASPRRSSLTEMIMAQAGDSVTMATANHSEGTGFGVSGGVPPAGPVASPVGRRPSRPLASKIPPADEGVDDVVKLEPVRSGMDVLADSASRLAEERKPQVRKDSTLRVGGTGPRYACQYCAKTFTRPSSLRIHTHSHTGARPFICPEPSCLRGFSVQSNLKRHAKTHQLGVAGHGGGASLQQLAVPGPKGRAVHPPPSRQPQKHLSLGEVKVEDIEEGEDELDDDEEDDEL